MSLLADDRFASVTQGDHVCAVYRDPEEQAEAMVRYIRTGLEAGERCVYISDDRKRDDVRDRLAAGGADVGAAADARRLLLLTERESYLRDGEFSPPAMVGFLRESEQDALVEGCTGLRVTGEMTWALGSDIDGDRLIEYEVALNAFLPGSRSHAICQYNRARFGPSVIRGVLRTHPIAILGQQVCPNPFYEPPELVLDADEAAIEARVDWMVEQLVRLRENEIRLRDAVAARDEFLSVASHELRTPLNALNLAVEALATTGVPQPHFARIQRQVQRLTRLLDSTFDVARLRDPRQRLAPEPCDLQAVVRDVVHRFDLETIGAGCPIHVDVPVIIGWWDRETLEEIVSSLVSNAVKYGAGQPIDVAAREHGASAVLRVRDRGIGVPSEDRERIFERYERAVPSRSYSGFGLGLWLVRECAIAMQGSVRLADTSGPGSTFEVLLPLNHATDSRR